MANFVNQLVYRCGTNYGKPASNVSVTVFENSLKISAPYNSGFVNNLKAQIPASARVWDSASKCWMVSVQYADILKSIIDAAYFCDVVMPKIEKISSESFQTTIRAGYVANSKDGASSVYIDKQIAAKIPEMVLRKFFKQEQENDGTLYGLLGINQTALADEIKKAYLRLAKQWHPDVCREANAAEKFREIKDAFDLLNDPVTRKKYNAGLFFEKLAKMSPKSKSHASFVPNLRCGEIEVKARKELGLLIVEDILDWRDSVNERGQTMVSFWSYGDVSFTTMWV